MKYFINNDFVEADDFYGELEELAKKIEKAFKQYNVFVKIDGATVQEDRFIVRLKLKEATREAQVLARARDVQLRLRLPLFAVITDKYVTAIVVSNKEIQNAHLLDVLGMDDYGELSNAKQLPYVVGYDILGVLRIADLCKLPHLLVAGTTNSGKTVGLKSLITSIAYSRSPSEVNFILIDVGANDLVPFDGIPHLSCPVISDKNVACKALILLQAEMERRRKLQSSKNSEFESLPRIVLVIDEFPALFVGTEDKQVIKVMTETVSCLLQRGRHAKIHVVLAAQNPTIQNMRVDLGNITARIAFKCAKRSFSDTILGEGGAEDLLGQGDMYFKSPQFSGMKRIKGTFISEEELSVMLFHIGVKWEDRQYDTKFTISQADLEQAESEMRSLNRTDSQRMKGGTDNERFAKVVVWALKQVSVSCNTLMKEFGIGWNKANRYIEGLTEMGIVDELDAKLPRRVIPQSDDEIPAEVKDFLESNGFPITVVSDISGSDNEN